MDQISDLISDNISPGPIAENPVSDDTAVSENETFEPAQRQLIDDMARYLRENNLPVYVVHFPAGSSTSEAQAFFCGWFRSSIVTC